MGKIFRPSMRPIPPPVRFSGPPRRPMGHWPYGPWRSLLIDETSPLQRDSAAARLPGGKPIRGVWLGLVLAMAPFGLAGCDDKIDRPFCSNGGCEFSEWEWQQIETLADLPPTPPDDPTNKFMKHPGAQALGQQFFFDGRFSGPSTMQDSLRRPTSYGRAAKGQLTGLTCNVCHDLRRGGVDTTSVPGNISIGSGWADTNALTVLNSAYYGIQYWSGRADSLWSQAVSSSEGNNMNGNRLATAWTIQDFYRPAWDQVFGEYPYPLQGKSEDVRKLIDPANYGQCKKVNDACPIHLGCRVAMSDSGAVGCWPKIPLDGRLGSKKGCQPGDASEPWGDAFDCMEKDDQTAITRILVNWAKSLAAFESRLVSRESSFDRFVREAKEKGRSSILSPAAQRGARLFVGKAACNDCHNTALFSDSQFYNIGIAQVGPGVPQESDCPDGATCDCVANPEPGNTDAMQGVRGCLPWGVRNGLQRLRSGEFTRTSVWSDDPSDQSRKRFFETPIGSYPVGAWRTPSLRDVALTAPYMHTGGFNTLEQVVAHYNAGGSANGTGHRSPRIKPLGLTEGEQGDLVAFMRSLTGQALPSELTEAPKLP